MTLNEVNIVVHQTHNKHRDNELIKLFLLLAFPPQIYLKANNKMDKFERERYPLFIEINRIILNTRATDMTFPDESKGWQAAARR